MSLEEKCNSFYGRNLMPIKLQKSGYRANRRNFILGLSLKKRKKVLAKRLADAIELASTFENHDLTGNQIRDVLHLIIGGNKPPNRRAFHKLCDVIIGPVPGRPLYNLNLGKVDSLLAAWYQCKWQRKDSSHFNVIRVLFQ